VRDDSGTQTAMSTLFVFYLLAFAASAVYSFIRVPDLLAIFRWPYIWTDAFVRFVDYAIPLTVAALAASYSLFLRRGRVVQPFYRLVSPQLTLLVVLAILYSVALLGFYPRSSGLLRELHVLTQVARGFLEKAQGLVQRGDLAGGLEFYERYLSIDPRNQQALDRRDELRRSLAAAPSEKPRPEPQPVPRIQDLSTGKNSYELLRMAQDFFNKEDYFSANYYATLAAQLDPSRQDAARLAARAWERIRGRDLAKLDKEAAAFYQVKMRGYQLYQDKDYLAAYYHFLQLQKQKPGDPDVLRFLAGSRAKVAQEAFFLDEARAADLLPGTRDLLFVNPREDGAREIVSIARMASGQEGTFFRGIEVVRFGGRSAPYHYRARYGKLKASETLQGQGQPKPAGRLDILLHGIDRQSRGRDLLPELLSGAEKPGSRELRYLLQLAPAREEVEALIAPSPAAQNSLAGVSLTALWQAQGKAGNYGQIEAFLSQEILMRLLLPFAFLNLGLLAMGIGWSYRFVSMGRPPLLAYLALPVFPLVASLATSLYLRAHRILLGYTLLAWSFRPALIALAVLEGAILALMLVLLAAQKAD
jgi:hypothetical protein